MQRTPRPAVRSLPPRPSLHQLKRQAKELLGAYRNGDLAAIAEVQAHFRVADARSFALHDAQLVLARACGFDSWPKLKGFVDGVNGVAGRNAMIRPRDLESAEGCDIWDAIVAASNGEVPALKRLLARNRSLARAEYWYAPVLHFAVRDGHAEAVRLLLDSGADPEDNGLNDRNLIAMARERGHEAIAAMLEEARAARGRVVAQTEDHPIHLAARRGNVAEVSALLDADPALVNRGSPRGNPPLHLAVFAGNERMVKLLLDRGANIHARGGGDREAIDVAVTNEHGHLLDSAMVRLLVGRGATYDLAIAAAVGDLEAVRRMLDADPERVGETRPGGWRPLSAAVENSHDAVARLLLERGTHPCWPEPDAPHGTSLHAAARLGNLTMVKLLLEHGADPNEGIDSTDSPTGFAATEEIRELLLSHGGELGEYDTGWIVGNEKLLREVAADPIAHEGRIGPAFVMSADKPDLLARLLDAGLRMPPVFTSCQGYLVNPQALRMLLAHGMSPDQMNWQHQTLLHHAATSESTECATILLDAGASMTVRDDDYRSTPLGWAARTNRPRNVELLLSRGAPVNIPDEEAWATPLAWAERRGHGEVAAILRAHGATR